MTVKMPFKEIKREGVDGYNLVEFPLMPLKYQATQCPESVHYEWEHKSSDGKVRQCFLNVEYGKVKPNASTDDTLLIISSLLNSKGKNSCLHTSCFEILTTKYRHYRPNQKKLKALIRDLEALMSMKIETNALYNPKEKTWEASSGRIISSYVYEYRSHEGKKVERTRILNEEISVENIKELKRINFDPEFYRHFLKDKVLVDLRIYFTLENPIAKRIFRIANKYTKHYKEHSEDLVNFCINKLGKSKKGIQKMKYTSTIAAQLRNYIDQVNNHTDDFSVKISKSRTKSGYKIVFFNTKKARPIHEQVKGLSFSEQHAFNMLCKEGIYPNAALKVINSARKQFGKQVADYLFFCIDIYEAFKKRQKRLEISEDKKGGILYKMICKADVMSQFREHYHHKNKQKEAISNVDIIKQFSEKFSMDKAIDGDSPLTYKN